MTTTRIVQRLYPLPSSVIGGRKRVLTVINSQCLTIRTTGSPLFSTPCTDDNDDTLVDVRKRCVRFTSFVHQRRFLSSSSSSSSSSWNTEEEDGYLTVSILGPPNAGKSTLFNRLMCKESNKSYRLSSEKKGGGGGGHRKKALSKGRVGHVNPSKRWDGAIVTSTPGTTRDRRECIGRIGGTKFKLVDTAGVDGERIGHLVGKMKDPLQRSMMQQTLEAARSSDLILLLFDARVGVTSDLAETARWLRKISAPPNKKREKQQQQTQPQPSALDGENPTRKEVDDDDDEEEENDRDTTLSTQREIVILANKLEGDKWAYEGSPILEHLTEATRVGFGEAIPISAEHGEGLADVAVVIEDLTRKKRERWGLGFNDYDDEAEYDVDSKHDGNSREKKPLQLAILGRQNVGKSTLVNALLKQERVIAGEMPGLTRDAIAVQWKWNGRPVKLVDTAGIRKVSKRNYDDVIEDLAVRDAMRAMKIADVAVLVLDAEARMLQRQELAIADAVVKEGRALVVAANKMDLLVDVDYSKEEYAKAVREQIEIRLPMLRNTPVVAMSSLTGECVEELMPVVFNARDRWAQIISTGILNRWLKEVLDAQPPPMHNGRTTKIKYIMQTKGRPPTFLLFCNVGELPVSYLRYLTRNFQDTFKMFGMEVRMAIKKSAGNPFKATSKRGGRGVGGREGRQKRLYDGLKKTGTKPKKGVRRRMQRR